MAPPKAQSTEDKVISSYRPLLTSSGSAESHPVLLRNRESGINIILSPNLGKMACTNGAGSFDLKDVLNQKELGSLKLGMFNPSEKVESPIGTYLDQFTPTMAKKIFDKCASVPMM